VFTVQGTLENTIEFLIILKISVHLRPELLRFEGENWGCVTTHVVSLKLFSLKAEGVRKARLLHFGGETVDSRAKHGFKMRRIPVFS
jgi:hypothetical protein